MSCSSKTSLGASLTPFNVNKARTNPWLGTDLRAASVLFLLCAGVTLAIWIEDPFAERAYEFIVFALAGWSVFQVSDLPKGNWAIRISLLAISFWGFGQLEFGATVYPSATLNAALRMAALAATALAARVFLRNPAVRTRFLEWFAWFALVLATISVVACFTSRGRILWMFPSPYPDVWGPFPSRNNFAQFLELALPVALWRAATEGRRWWIPAVILAAGLASASRAGAALLMAETVVVLFLLHPTRWRWVVPTFVLGTVSMAALANGGTLLGRLSDPNPLRFRQEIFRSTVAMIRDRPWEGFGLGSYRAVYPEYATFDTGSVVEHAHNDWLEWAAEGGIPFAVAWVALAAWVFRPAIRSIWGIGVLAVFAHGLVDYPFARLGISAWVFILIGVLENTPTRSALTHRRIA